MLSLMAGQERLGRETLPGGRPLLRESGVPARYESGIPARTTSDVPRLTSDAPTPTGLRRMQQQITGPLPPMPVPVRITSAPEITIEGDDDNAETRLYKPRTDPTTLSLRGKRSSSSVPAGSKRPSRGGVAMSSRPGALIAIPADVPSVRMRFDSDVELKDTRSSQLQILEAPVPRGASMLTKVLTAAIVLTVLVLTLHEIAVVFHMPRLDPANLLHKLALLRAKL
jgi:hypothetical protein